MSRSHQSRTRLLTRAPLFAALIAVSLFADPQPQPRVTLLLQFENERSEQSVEAMKREVVKILKDADISFDFRVMSELGPDDTFSDLIVVKFKGTCKMETYLAPPDERGPLAWTHTTSTEVQPFSEVQCDKVRVSVRSAMWAGDVKRGDELLGRALGRVLAHEIYHIMAGARGHGSKGVAKTAISGAQLISNSLDMHPDELGKIKELRGRSLAFRSIR